VEKSGFFIVIIIIHLSKESVKDINTQFNFTEVSKHTYANFLCIFIYPHFIKAFPDLNSYIIMIFI
jgi:membrane-anchored protein YejM (alkaline phosphatase superfamily)